jgi:hypothetical protein
MRKGKVLLFGETIKNSVDEVATIGLLAELCQKTLPPVTVRASLVTTGEMPANAAGKSQIWVPMKTPE